MNNFEINEKTFEILKSILEKDGYDFREIDPQKEKGGVFGIDENGNKTKITDSLNIFHPLFEEYLNNQTNESSFIDSPEPVNLVSIENNKENSSIFEDSELYSEQEMEMITVDNITDKSEEIVDKNLLEMDLHNMVSLSTIDSCFSQHDLAYIWSAA